MYLKTTICLSFFVLLSAKINSQISSQGFLHLKVYGVTKPVCLIDTIQVKTNDTIMALSIGPHRLKIWSSTTKPVDTTLNIKASDTIKHSSFLEHSLEYLNYKIKYENYKSVQNKRFFISPIGIVTTIGLGVFINKHFAEKQYQLALDCKGQYNLAASQALMNEKKEEFEIHKKKYNNFKKIEYGMYGFSALLAANYVRILIKQSHTPVPVFKKDNLLSKVDLNIYPSPDHHNFIYGLIFHF